MTIEDLRKIVHEIQQHRMESDTVEVKTARGGTPKKLYEALSALTNRTGGGIILFGLDESKDFSIVGVGDAHRLQEEITSLASDNMEPALRPQFTVDDIDGLTVVAAEIDEIPASQKPCFYKNAGLPKGAYLRVGNTNRQMTEYEMFGYLSGREQPTNDEDTVPDASLEDLDNSLIETYLERLRQIRPRAGFLKGGNEEILLQLRIAVQDSDVIRPTLAGLLTFGKYPQEFYPQLMITFVQYFGTTEDERTPQGARFDGRRASFKVTFHNHTLMTEQAISWLNQFSHLQLNDHQRLALVYLRQHSHIDNRDYRRLNHVGMMSAGQDLRGMVQTGFVEQTGFGRWTKYILKVQEQRAEEPKTPSHEETILAHVKKHGSINNTECRDLLEIDLNKASYLLKKLAKKGILKQSGKRRWTRYRLS